MEFVNNIKIIWKFLSKYRQEVYVIFVVAFFTSMIETVIPYIYGKIVDLIIADEKLSVLILALFIWLILSFIKDWGKRYVSREGGIVGVRCSNDLVLSLNKHVLRLSVKFHKKQKTGKLASKYIKASDFMEQFMREVIFWFVPHLLTILLVYFVILHIEWRIAFVFGLIILIFIAVTLKNIDRISKLLVKAIEHYEESCGIIYDSVSNIQVVKSNTNEDFEDKKAKLSFDNVESGFKKFSYAWARLDLYQHTVVSVGTVIIFSMIVFCIRLNHCQLGKL